MSSSSRPSVARLTFGVGILATLALITTACATTSSPATSGTDAASSTLSVGTTDKVAALDPAAQFDAGSSKVTSELYTHLLANAPGGTELQPDIAVSAEFDTPISYTARA